MTQRKYSSETWEVHVAATTRHGYDIQSAGGQRLIAYNLKNKDDAKLISQAPRMFELLKLIGARMDLEEQVHPGGPYLGAAYRDDIHRIIQAIEGE